MQANLSQFTFGVELEVLLPGHFNRITAAAELGRRIGKTVDQSTGAGRNWSIHFDGSIRGNGAALEFVSPFNPPLQGEEGLREAAAVANALRDLGAEVNASTGFHVHVGVRNHRLGLDFFKTLVKVYGRYEEALDSILPASRRNNGFCRSIKNVPHSAIDAARSIPELSRAIYRSSGAAAPRYHKLNLEAYDKHGTVEFRHHSGTVDASKITNWILTVLGIVAAAKEGRTGAGTQIARDFAAFEAKTRAVITAISRPSGATLKEICSEFGFAKISVKRHARLAGIAFRKGRGQRYYAIEEASSAGVTLPATIEGLAELIDATAEQREFFRARRAALSRTA